MRVESLGYQTDLMLRELEGSAITDQGDYLVIRSPAHPEFWGGNFLLLPGSALGDEAAPWVARFAAAFPQASGAVELPGGVDFERRRARQARLLAEAGHGACFGAFLGGRLVAQLGVFSDGSGTARYQNVETHPAARRQGLAGTLVCHAGWYALDGLAASRLVIVADPGYSAIRIYRSVGFADRQTQLGLQREPVAG